MFAEKITSRKLIEGKKEATCFRPHGTDFRQNQGIGQNEDEVAVATFHRESNKGRPLIKKG